MEFNETQTMAINFTKMAKEKMGDKVKDFCISDIYDDVNNRAFSVEFAAYDWTMKEEDLDAAFYMEKEQWH